MRRDYMLNRRDAQMARWWALDFMSYTVREKLLGG